VAGLALALAKNGGAQRTLANALLVAAFAAATFASHGVQAQNCEVLFKSADVITTSGEPESMFVPPIAEMNAADIKPGLEMIKGLDLLTRPDLTYRVLGERRELIDFLDADPTKNLAVRAPFTIMNAAQKMLALVYSQGQRKIRLQLTGEEVTEYPFFSAGLPVTNGFRLVGGEKAVVQFVNNMKSQAGGDRSGSSIPLLAGSHGTGKSESLKLLAIAAEKLTSEFETPFAAYTYEWTNLEKIEDLVPLLPSSTDINGKRIYPNLEAPLGDSPFTLLPKEVQDLVVGVGTESAAKLLEGMAPLPFAAADPISHFIRNLVVQHYAKSPEFGRPLNPLEVVQVLNRHIVVKRQIIGQSYGRMPLIDASGNDVDTNGLFMAPNPSIRFTQGPAHPMAWYYNGKILSGHGNAILFDEVFRNPPELLNTLLGAFEGRRLSINGAPTVPFDAVMIAATNTANLKDVGADDKGAAAIDRFKQSPLRWSTFPNEVVALMLEGKKSTLLQQSLELPDAPLTVGDIRNDLVPRVEGNARILTSDYRFRLFFDVGGKRVEVAPHTLLMMGEILAATRLELDPQKAGREMKGKILTSNLLRNPIDRLRLYEGLKSDVQPDEIRELGDVATLLKQGESGISARDGGRWFTDALQAAATDKTGYTLTPGVALKVLRIMLNEGSMKSPSTKERLRWLELAEEVVNKLLMPRISNDIQRALANGDRVVNDAYYNMLDEMFQLHSDPNAKTYQSTRNSQEETIDRERLAAVEAIYLSKNGQPLNISQIAIFHSRQTSAGGAARVPDEALLDAISEYYAEVNSKAAGFSALVDYERTGSGDDAVQSRHSSLVTALHAMGYNDVAIRDALNLKKARDSANQPVPQQ
jgi:predicted Ser/Thr protein kinase